MKIYYLSRDENYFLLFLKSNVKKYSYILKMFVHFKIIDRLFNKIILFF